jgi:hypothetical protein
VRRLSTSRIVDETAQATRNAYARLSLAKRNLRFSLNQLSDWDTLEAFARSAQNNSKYRYYDGPAH